MLHGTDSLIYCWSRGRKPRLTKMQKRRLTEMIKADPLEAGYLTACWTSLLIQQLIPREFGVLYNRHYVCELVHNLAFSFQQDRLTVFQLPSYTPDYNPTEFLWKKMKQRATHNQYCPVFEALASSVENALA